MSLGTRHYFPSWMRHTSADAGSGSSDDSSSDDSNESLTLRRERVRATDLPVLKRSDSGPVGRGRTPNPLTVFKVPSDQKPLTCLDRPMAQTTELFRFRSTAEVPDELNINRLGLDQLKMSGSASIASKANAEELLAYAKSQGCELVVIDRRAEPHAIANDEVPITYVGVNNWLGWGKTPEERQHQQDKWIGKLFRRGRLKLAILADIKKAVKPFITWLDRPKIISEKELFESMGVLYFSESAVDDLCRPTREQADAGIQIQRKLESRPSKAINGYWLHVHCKGGSGRTLTGMIEKDCRENAHQVSFEDIVGRQCLLAGKDPNCLKEKANKAELPEWRRTVVDERWIYLKSYYEFCKAKPCHPDGQAMLYSEWRKSDAAPDVSDNESACPQSCRCAPGAPRGG
jgi:hypothetical protein